MVNHQDKVIDLTDFLQRGRIEICLNRTQTVSKNAIQVGDSSGRSYTIITVSQDCTSQTFSDIYFIYAMAWSVSTI